MSNERFTVPEVIFNPSTIGSSPCGHALIAKLTSPSGRDQAGLCESIAHSIASLPEELQGLFWSNIVCVGGSAGFPGFAERLSVHNLTLWLRRLMRMRQAEGFTFARSRGIRSRRSARFIVSSTSVRLD